MSAQYFEGLIPPADLSNRLGDEQLVVLDVRWGLDDPGAGRREYAKGHVPGALYVDLEEDLADPG